MAIATEAPALTCPSCNKEVKQKLDVCVMTYTDPHFHCKSCRYSGTLHWTRTHGTWKARKAQTAAQQN